MSGGTSAFGMGITRTPSFYILRAYRPETLRMQEMYGIEVDATRVSKITDKPLPLIHEWQNQPLESVHAMVMLDAIHYTVREEGIVVKKAV